MYIQLPRLYNEFTKAYVFPTAAKFRLYYTHWGGIPYFFLFSLIKFLFHQFQKIWWKMNGVQKLIDRINQGEFYELSAHVLTVIESCKVTAFDKVRGEHHYFTFHHSFQHPDIVLADNVMLADITLTKAFFVQLPHNLDHYSAKSSPFLWLTLVKEATKIIEMPLSSFHRLAEQIGHPSGRYENITFLFNIGRSGSTVVSQIIEEADPDTIVLSEPSILYPFSMQFFPPVFAKSALRSAMYIMLKPMLNKKRVLIKPHYMITRLAKQVHDVLPQAKMLFIYRDHLKVIRSHVRAFGASPVYFMMMASMYLKLWSQTVGLKLGLVRDGMHEHYINKYLKTTIFDACVMAWAAIWRDYKLQAEQFEFTGIYYDDLLENPTEFTKNILKLFDLPESRLQKAMSVLGKDAQEGTLLARSTLTHISGSSYGDDIKERINFYCKSLNLPLLSWDDHNNNTFQSSMHKSSASFRNFVSHTKMIHCPCNTFCHHANNIVA